VQFQPEHGCKRVQRSARFFSTQHPYYFTDRETHLWLGPKFSRTLNMIMIFHVTPNALKMYKYWREDLINQPLRVSFETLIMYNTALNIGTGITQFFMVSLWRFSIGFCCFYSDLINPTLTLQDCDSPPWKGTSLMFVFMATCSGTEEDQSQIRWSFLLNTCTL